MDHNADIVSGCHRIPDSTKCLNKYSSNPHPLNPSCFVRLNNPELATDHVPSFHDSTRILLTHVNSDTLKQYQFPAFEKLSITGTSAYNTVRAAACSCRPQFALLRGGGGTVHT